MQQLKMRNSTLYKETCDIIDEVEEILQKNLYISNANVSTKLETKFGYSLSHMRAVFSLATEMRLYKYIVRRHCTIILCKKFDAKEFDNLSSAKTICNIRNFKRRCLSEFPLIARNYTEEHMQPAIDKNDLLEQLEERISHTDQIDFERYLYREVTANRTLIAIPDSQTRYLIYDDIRTCADLDCNYFLYKDHFFKITAEAYNFPCEKNNIENRNDALHQLFCYAPYIPVSAQTTVHYLHDFLNKKNQIPYGISICIECNTKDKWHLEDLISNLNVVDGQIDKIKLSNHPFLMFESEKAFLDLRFFDE